MKMSVMNAKMGKREDLKNKNFIFEPKLDGFRALCHVNTGLKFVSRNDKDLNKRFPSVLGFRKAIKAKTALLDGEIVAYNAQCIPSFSLLQEGGEATFVVFDILMKNGKSLVHLPLMERKKILEETIGSGPNLEIIFYTTDGPLLWKKIKEKKLEGVMAKEVNSEYYQGMRSNVWRKIKIRQTLDCVIIGYEVGKRALASLAVAVYNKSKLQYLGNVGTGYSFKTIEDLLKKLKKIEIDTSPIPELHSNTLQWIKPQLVCEVNYAELTHLTTLRQASFLRLRDDKKPKDCTLKSQI